MRSDTTMSARPCRRRMTAARSTDDVAALKEQDGGGIFIHGSAELASEVLAARYGADLSDSP